MARGVESVGRLHGLPTKGSLLNDTTRTAYPAGLVDALGENSARANCCNPTYYRCSIISIHTVSGDHAHRAVATSVASAPASTLRQCQCRATPEACLRTVSRQRARVDAMRCDAMKCLPRLRRVSCRASPDYSKVGSVVGAGGVDRAEMRIATIDDSTALPPLFAMIFLMAIQAYKLLGRLHNRCNR